MLKQGLVVLCSTLIAYWIFGLLLHFGVFRHVYNHAPGDCFPVSGIETGSEDLQVLPNGQTFISSGINILGTSGRVGRIYFFDMNSPKVPAVELKIIGEEKYKTLNPHGLSIWTNPKTGDVYLYVINHTPGGEAVDKFKFNGPKKTLEHVRRIENQPDFHLINDLIVVGEDQFYFTNCLYWNHNFETLFSLHWSSIGFYDGKTAKLVETGLLSPNGIAVSKDGKTLYIAHIGHEELRVYKRNADNSLTFLQSVFLGTIPDNLDVDFETGDVWTGAHPSFYKFVFKHVSNTTEHSPSQVLRIHFPAESTAKPEVVEVYSNDGIQLSASSVAARYKNGLLIGSVFREALYCHLTAY